MKSVAGPGNEAMLHLAYLYWNVWMWTRSVSSLYTVCG